jgi:hypothetical protein
MNELTQKLFEAGYTKEDHPEYVEWSNYKDFEYTPKFLYNAVLESPCGLLMNGINSYSHMGYMGISWCPENNNSAHTCPCKKAECKLNHELLRSSSGYTHKIVQCAFRFSNKVYDYENSIEKAWDEFNRLQEQKRRKFYNRLKWNPEAEHCECIRWDDKKHDWYAKYDPWFCVRGCYNNICVLTGRKLDEKKGNVFYDVRVTRVIHDSTFWDGQKVISITKGKKMFGNPKPLAICEAYAKLCKDWIVDREKNLFYKELYFHPDTKIEVLNVRAEQRESRDLIQDLRDAQEGIEVVHASDAEKNEKKAKSERIKKAKEDRRRRRENRSIAKWKRILMDNEFAKQYALENGVDINFLREYSENELKKRGIALQKEVEQLSMF